MSAPGEKRLPDTHRPYVMFPDPRLRAVADPVEAVTDETRAMWDEMLLAMYTMPGVGLAAPQLGIGLRLAVLDCSDTRDQPVRLANPEIVSLAETSIAREEGSPNLPRYYEQVERPISAEVRFLNQWGKEEVQTFRAMWSASVQHQIDHLNGKLFIDRLPAFRRRRLLEKHRKQTRGRKPAKG